MCDWIVTIQWKLVHNTKESPYLSSSMSTLCEGVEPQISYRPLPQTRPSSVSNSAVTKLPATPRIYVKPEDTLPTPRPSLDRSRQDLRPTPGPSFDNVQQQALHGKLRDIYEKFNSGLQTQGLLEDVSVEDFDWLKQKGESGEIVGWENTRLDTECFMYTSAQMKSVGLTIWTVLWS